VPQGRYEPDDRHQRLPHDDSKFEDGSPTDLKGEVINKQPREHHRSSKHRGFWATLLAEKKKGSNILFRFLRPSALVGYVVIVWCSSRIHLLCPGAVSEQPTGGAARMRVLERGVRLHW